jgi:hypothetical protein
MAMAGLAIGPRTSPTIAEMASRLRMAHGSFIDRESFDICAVNPKSAKDAKCGKGCRTRKAQSAERN